MCCSWEVPGREKNNLMFGLGVSTFLNHLVAEIFTKVYLFNFRPDSGGHRANNDAVHRFRLGLC